jgi:hypothetical protein
MGTVIRVKGFRIMVFAHDHDPPHVHIVGSGRAKIMLGPNKGRQQLAYQFGISKGDLRGIMAAIAENHDLLIAEWEKFHGSID